MYEIPRAVLDLPVVIPYYAFIITQKFNKYNPAYLNKALLTAAANRPIKSHPAMCH